MQTTHEAPVCPYCGQQMNLYLCEIEPGLKVAGWTCRCETFASVADKMGAKPF